MTLATVDQLRELYDKADTPRKAFEVETASAAALAYAKEQRDYEMAFEYFKIYILSRCHTTELILPTIPHGGNHGSNQYAKWQSDDIVTLADYGFTRKQWERRRKELDVSDRLDEYIDDCVVKDILPTNYGLIRFVLNLPVSHNSGDNEWYTPPYIIEPARRVMGGIDLDPASSAEANKIVKATRYYTVTDNGLAYKWEGRAWMNPPYSSPEVNQFTKKLVDEIEAGNITQAVVLVNNATETAWFQRLLSVCRIVCLIKGRVKYLDEFGNAANSPLQGQIILYFGNNLDGFAKEFGGIGKILYAR